MKMNKLFFGEKRIHFGKLSDKLVGSDYRLRTYYYFSMPYQSNPPTEEERRRYENTRRYLASLERINRFEIRFGKLVKRRDDRGERFEQKGVDVLLSVDLVRMSFDHQIDAAVLLTGDSDFVPAVRAAKEAGVIVRLYYVPGNCGDDLITTCDESYEIDEDLIRQVHLD